MKRTLGSRLVAEHGLISNILSGLCLVDQVVLSSVCRRSYEITVPWNISIGFPTDVISVFPKLDEISNGLVCKRMKVIVEGEIGYFYGPASHKFDIPSGEGVYVTRKHVHCGRLINGVGFEGEKLSLNRKTGQFETKRAKYLPDGTLLQKIIKSSTSLAGVSFYRN